MSEDGKFTPGGATDVVEEPSQEMGEIIDKELAGRVVELLRVTVDDLDDELQKPHASIKNFVRTISWVAEMMEENTERMSDPEAEKHLMSLADRRRSIDSEIDGLTKQLEESYKRQRYGSIEGSMFSRVQEFEHQKAAIDEEIKNALNPEPYVEPQEDTLEPAEVK